MQVSHKYMALQLYACFKAPKRKWFTIKPCLISAVVVGCDGISRLACCFEHFCSFVGEHILQETCWGEIWLTRQHDSQFQAGAIVQTVSRFRMASHPWSEVIADVKPSESEQGTPPPTHPHPQLKFCFDMEKGGDHIKTVLLMLMSEWRAEHWSWFSQGMDVSGEQNVSDAAKLWTQKKWL